MSGQTNNTDHLAAYNQIIQAVNDLQLSIETGNPPVNIATILGDIQNNIESLEATLDARSQAETVAQNTNFSNLISALASLKPNNCCCGEISGYAPPSTGSYEGGPVPTNPSDDVIWKIPSGAPTPTIPGTTVYYDRKCKVANGIIEDIKSLIDMFLDLVVVEYAFDLWFTAIGGAIGGGIDLILPGSIIWGAVIGFVLDVSLILLNQNVDLGLLKTFLANNQQDLVCALYNSTSHIETITNVSNLMSGAGQNAGNILLINTLLAVDIVSYLWFSGPEILEANLAAYTPPIDCSMCECTETIVNGTIDTSIGFHTWSSGHRSSPYPNELMNFCYCAGGVKQLRVKFLAFNGWVDAGGGFTDFRLWSTCASSNSPADVFVSQDAPPPLNQEFVFNELIFWGANPFSVDVEVLGEV